MTEFNIFCYSNKYNDINSFQQKRFRAFNKEVSESRYYEISSQINDIIQNKNKNKLKLADFWESITIDQWNKLLSIPEANDFKEGFEYISGREIESTEEMTEEMTLEQVCKELGRNVKIIKNLKV